MTVHKKMFDNGKKDCAIDTQHRIYVEWEGGYFVTSLDPEFHKNLQEMVADMGPPANVEFRDTAEGWSK